MVSISLFRQNLWLFLFQFFEDVAGEVVYAAILTPAPKQSRLFWGRAGLHLEGSINHHGPGGALRKGIENAKQTRTTCTGL
jgi:hypothetical protein